ncbi:MAG: hypothetical protein IJK98_07655 [Clostridia bacterium]|nr:hypothetical protein [Clostridia bacterium]
MKKKNKQKTAAEQTAPAPRMTRREARIAARLSEEQKETREVFRERMKNAPPRMRLKTVRTKGYYRFSREYPGDAGVDGYRTNKPPVRKLSGKGILLASLLCAAVFCLGFIVTRSAMLVSMLPGDADYLATFTDADAVHEIAAMRFTAEDLAYYGPGDLKRMLDEYECNTALFEFKDAAGYIVFPTELAKGAADDRIVENAWETVTGLEEMGVRTAAYISCFRDSAALSEDDGWAVRDFDNPDEPFYDADGAMWLDPYLPDAAAYLTGLMQAALDGGFSYVVLDNVSFPYGLSLTTPYYSGADVADKGDNSILLDFLAQALDVTGTKQLVLMCDVNGIAAEATNRDNRYGGSLLTCGAEVFAVDARIGMLPENEPDPLGIFAYKDDVPTAFILSACSKAADAAKASEYVSNPRVLVCVENDGNAGAMKELLSHTGLNDYIIW